MTARRVPTIGDRTVRRIPWADLADSSQEISKDETLLVPAAPVVDDSYDTPALGFDNSRDGMNSRFKKMETLHEAVNSGPINFGFLLDGNSSSQAASSSMMPPPTGSFSSGMSASGPGFATRMRPHPPTSPRGSPADPPSQTQDVEQRRKKRRAKRPLSTVLDPSSVKRTREQESHKDDAVAEEPPNHEPPPWASQEDWEHRIFKRKKVVSSIKEKPEYIVYCARRPLAARLDGEPMTPVAEDRNLSKRRWEYEIQQWRDKLKRWAVEHVPEQFGEAEENSPEMADGD
jgi:hypothetical protein